MKGRSNLLPLYVYSTSAPSRALNILSAVILSCSSIELFPMTGNGGGDVEAKLIIEDRSICIEAKALGYSGHDLAAPYNGYVGPHSVPSMIQQIYDALNEKLAKGKIRILYIL